MPTLQVASALLCLVAGTRALNPAYGVPDDLLNPSYVHFFMNMEDTAMSCDTGLYFNQYLPVTNGCQQYVGPADDGALSVDIQGSSPSEGSVTSYTSTDCSPGTEVPHQWMTFPDNKWSSSTEPAGECIKYMNLTVEQTAAMFSWLPTGEPTVESAELSWQVTRKVVSYSEKKDFSGSSGFLWRKEYPEQYSCENITEKTPYIVWSYENYCRSLGATQETLPFFKLWGKPLPAVAAGAWDPYHASIICGPSGPEWRYYSDNQCTNEITPPADVTSTFESMHLMENSLDQGCRSTIQGPGKFKTLTQGGCPVQVNNCKDMKRVYKEQSCCGNQKAAKKMTILYDF